MKLNVTHVNEFTEAVDFAFGNTTFTVVVRDGEKDLKASVPNDAAYDLPNWVLAKAPRQAKTIIRERRERSSKRRARRPRAPEQLQFPTRGA